MTLRQMRYFVAVAEAGSVSAAARALNVSQPALCYQVKALEERLGVVLFQRHARGAIPTQAGRALMGPARGALQAVAAAERSVDPFRGGAPVHLTFGVTPTSGRALLPDLLDATGGGGELRLVVHQRLTDELVEAMRSGELDAALCYDPPAISGVAAWPLYREDLFLVGPPDLVRDTAPIAFQALAGLPLVLDGRLRSIRALIDGIASSSGLALDLLEVEPITLKREIILRHGRCTIVPYGLFLDEIGDGRVRARRIVTPALTRTLKLLVSERVAGSSRDRLRGLLQNLVQAEITQERLGWRHAGQADAVSSPEKVVYSGIS